MTLHSRTSLTASVILCLILVKLSNALADENAPRIIEPQRIQSWVVEPFMSQEEERYIWDWLRNRPRLFQSIKTLRELSQSFPSPRVDESHFPISLNAEAMSEIGVDIDEQLDQATGAVGYPLGTELLAVLEPHDLTCVVRHGKLQITTTENAEAYPVVRVYDVTSLVAVQARGGKMVVDVSGLIDTIQISVSPDTWEILGGLSTISKNILNNRCLLVIRAPTMVHIDVQQLLDQFVVAGRVPESKFTSSDVTAGDLRPEHSPTPSTGQPSAPLRSSDSIPTSVW